MVEDSAHTGTTSKLIIVKATKTKDKNFPLIILTDTSHSVFLKTDKL